MKNKLLLCYSLSLSAFLLAEDNVIHVPEGKIVSHPSIYQDITPSAGPRVIEGYGIFFTGDYTYWTARQEHLEYAISGLSSINTDAATKGRKHNVEYGFDSGFKAGMGFSFGHDKWDLYFNYTWFLSDNNSGSTKHGADRGQLFNLLYTPIAQSSVGELSTGAVTKGRAMWRLRFNVLDLELGRNFYISKFLSLRPFFGFKGTWQSQLLKVRYHFIQAPFAHIKAEQDFLGVGIRAGLNTAWHLAANWSIYGDASFSAVWGLFDEKRRDTAIEGDSRVRVYNMREDFHSIKPALELAVGLRKEGWFNKDRFHIAAQAGWEEQIWFGQNQLDYIYDTHDGDLTLQGLTAKIRFDF